MAVEEIVWGMFEDGDTDVGVKGDADGLSCCGVGRELLKCVDSERKGARSDNVDEAIVVEVCGMSEDDETVMTEVEWHMVEVVVTVGTV